MGNTSSLTNSTAGPEGNGSFPNATAGGAGEQREGARKPGGALHLLHRVLQLASNETTTAIGSSNMTTSTNTSSSAANVTRASGRPARLRGLQYHHRDLQARTNATANSNATRGSLQPSNATAMGGSSSSSNQTSSGSDNSTVIVIIPASPQQHGGDDDDKDDDDDDDKDRKAHSSKSGGKPHAHRALRLQLLRGLQQQSKLNTTSNTTSPAGRNDTTAASALSNATAHSNVSGTGTPQNVTRRDDSASKRKPGWYAPWPMGS